MSTDANTPERDWLKWSLNAPLYLAIVLVLCFGMAAMVAGSIRGCSPINPPAPGPPGPDPKPPEPEPKKPDHIFPPGPVPPGPKPDDNPMREAAAFQWGWRDLGDDDGPTWSKPTQGYGRTVDGRFSMTHYRIKAEPGHIVDLNLGRRITVQEFEEQRRRNP